MMKLPLLVERARRAPPWVGDTALAVGIFGIGTLELIFFAQFLVQPPYQVAAAWSIPVFAAMSLPLAMRRAHLWAAYVVIEAVAVFAAQTHLVVAYGLGSMLVFTVLLYSVGEQSSGLLTAALTIGQAGYYYALEFEAIGHPSAATLLRADLLYYVPMFGFPAFAGWAQRRRRRMAAELEERMAEAEHERELLSGQAVARERIRIATELRALVVQGVSRMTAIATSALGDLERAPERARDSIALLETAGRGTLVEMRRLLGVLRRADQAMGTVPGEREGAMWAADHSVPAPDREALRASDRLRGILARRWLIDAAIAGVITLLAVLEFGQADPADPYNRWAMGWLPRVLMAIVVLAVLFRRTAPFTMLTVIAGCEFIWILMLGNAPGAADRAVLVAVYTVGAYKEIGWAIGAVGMGIFAWSSLPLQGLCLCQIHIGALSTFAAIAGHSMLVLRQTNRALQEQTDLVRNTREERIRLAVEEERTRVARDMHDVVAHAVTGMVVQAGGARMVAAGDPELAVATLRDIRQIGLDALAELQELVELLDTPGLKEEGEVHEDTVDIRAILERARRAGVEIAFDQEGDPCDDPGIQVSLYRIVQEAVTNIRKHAPGAMAVVTIRNTPELVELEVRNAAPSAWPGVALPGAGLGLIGIAERAATFGGTTEAGPTPDGGFRIRVRLPRELALV